jgi:DNA-binding XRE family transcriptional regulator
MSAIGKQVAVQVAGKRLVILEQSEYERLCRLAGEVVGNDDEPPALLTPDENGRVPAIEFTRISIARDIIRERKAMGLTRESLAGLAGTRVETIARIESGKHTPSVRTIDKIDRALKRIKEKQSAARQPIRSKKGK